MKFFCSVIVVLSFTCLVQAADSCGSCQPSNEVLCINQTSYQICMNDKPLTRVYNCASGKVCSDVDEICVDEDTPNINDVCGPSSTSCGNCPTGTKYTCVSRTQFARCVGGDVDPSMVLSCDTDEVCVQELLTRVGNICAPSCVVDFYSSSLTGKICLNNVYETTTTTSAPPVTPSVASLKAACTAGMPTTPTSTYFYVLNPSDVECKSYVYCETINNVMYPVVMSCKSGLYFNIETNKCQSTQPANCGASSTSTSTESTSTSSVTAPTSSASTPTSSVTAPTSSDSTPTTSTTTPSSSSDSTPTTSTTTPSSSSDSTPTTSTTTPSSSSPA